jgi:hypothetical protein
MVLGLIFRPIPVAIVPIMHDLFILFKKILTMVGLIINVMELRQIDP